MALSSATLQLAAAVATLTFVLVTGIEGLLGLGPAIFLTTAALAAFPAGRAMDRFGRVPVLAAGFVMSIVGCIVTGIGVRTLSAPLTIAGFVLVGSANGVVLLSRAAAGDMYPPERRARGIAWVLFGAVFGAILGPLVFSPLLSGRDLDGDSLARSEEHTSELQSRQYLVCRLLLEKKTINSLIPRILLLLHFRPTSRTSPQSQRYCPPHLLFLHLFCHLLSPPSYYHLFPLLTLPHP